MGVLFPEISLAEAPTLDTVSIRPLGGSGRNGPTRLPRPTDEPGHGEDGGRPPVGGSPAESER